MLIIWVGEVKIKLKCEFIGPKPILVTIIWLLEGDNYYLIVIGIHFKE